MTPNSTSCSSDQGPVVSALSQYLAAVGEWMWMNQLKLKANKTEVMAVGRPLYSDRIETSIIDGFSLPLSLRFVVWEGSWILCCTWIFRWQK